MDLALLERVLLDRGEPAYRARQAWEWAARGVASYEEMTTGLRHALGSRGARAVLDVEVASERESRAGTVKTLFRTHDGHPVEAVLRRHQAAAARCACPRSPDAR